MNVYYTKTALYAYSNIETITEQIDEIVLKRALSSMSDCSPAIEQCEKIIDFTFQKKVLFALKLHIDSILKKLDKLSLDCLEYKYFKRKDKDYFINFDFESRAYFRKQIKLAKEISCLFEKAGLTDKWFEKYCLKIDFIKELLKRTIEHEKSYNSNKKVKKPKSKVLLKVISA